MNDRDQEEFAKAEEADKVSSVNQSDTQTAAEVFEDILCAHFDSCLLYTSPSPRDQRGSRMPSSA